MEAVIYTQYDSKGQKVSSLYGGLLTENVIQAMSRDLLLAGMFAAEERGLKIIMTIHDEIVCEVPENSPLGLKDLLECMTTTPAWAEGMGFTLAAEGWEGQYYKK